MKIDLYSKTKAMKKLLLLLFCVSASAQISTTGEEVPETVILSNGKHLGLEISYVDEGGKNRYVMTFRNRKYHNILDFRHVSFTATDEELNDLYTAWDKAFEDQKEKRYAINDVDVSVIPKGREVYFFVYDPNNTDSFFIMNRKNLAKAFGL